MKKTIIVICVLTALQLQAEDRENKHEVISGGCYLEQSGEFIKINNVDSLAHFGMFAEGYSSKGDRVYLTENFDSGNSIDINFQWKSGFSSSSIFEVLSENSKPTRIRMSNWDGKEWLSCDLLVR